MLERLVDKALEQRFLVALAALALVAAGVWAMGEIRLDAIPDLTDTQVIVMTRYPGQAPQVVEDQVTYPVTSQMLGVPGARAVRGYSSFGTSLVYVLFDDDTDLYWARSRVLELLSGLSDDLPAGVTPQLGPDATGVGWAFMYVINSPERSLAELRSIQDWYLRYGLTSVEGVSEVASVGGFVRQYQIELDPERLRALGVTVSQVSEAVRRSNRDVGGRLLEAGERELAVRGLGLVGSVRDLEQIPLDVSPGGVPLMIEDVARVTIGPESRRGLAEWNGEGETVAGIVVVRSGADTRETIRAVKARLAELEKGLPDDVTVSVAYDRSGLIDGAVETLTHTLIEESIIVALVALLFLFHLRSALVAILSIPLALFASLVVMNLQGLGANIMSLGGIAISIGVLVDAAIVLVENVHKHREDLGPEASQRDVVAGAAREVAPTLFFTLLVITVSFLPVFALEGQEGKLFRPLAFTKTYAMAASAILAVTVVPVFAFWLVRGKLRSEERHPVSRWLRRLYLPLLDGALRNRLVVLGLAGILIASIVLPAAWTGSEFMPPLWEGDILYMPTTLPGVSITKAKELLQQTDRIIASFPEVESVAGKVGRAETATDPAPLSMIETHVQLKDRSEWRPGMTPEKLIAELDRAVRIPGLTNAWTMPIETRIDMLSTGIRTPVGIKVAGPDLETVERVGQQIESVVATLPGTRSVFADRVLGGTYVDVTVDRQAAARYGLTVGDVQDVIQSAVGGMNVDWTIEGRERYPINVRFPRELRDDLGVISEILVTAPTGAQVPLASVADLEVTEGPPMIKSENAQLNSWVYVDLTADTDLGGYVERVRRAVAEQVDLPAGVSLTWSGRYESMIRAKKRLTVLVPLTLLLIVLILHVATRSWAKTGLVLLAVPFSLVGAVWLVWALGYNWSVAVWVGMIALAGLDAETGVVMLLYLDLAYEKTADKAKAAGRMLTPSDLIAAVREGAVGRVRPKTMTVVTTFMALVPILWATGIGADVMRRIAAPMVGGIVTSFAGELLVIPVLYYLWRSRNLEAPADPS